MWLVVSQNVFVWFDPSSMLRTGTLAAQALTTNGHKKDMDVSKLEHRCLSKTYRTVK